MGFKTATVYIVRHGETVGNDTKLIMRPDEDVLNESGKVQAANLGDDLKDVHFTRVYTSNYPRTVESASIILSHNLKSKNVPTKTDERLREVGIEGLYGKPYALLLGAMITFLKSKKHLDEFAVSGSEPLPEVRKRTKEFLLDFIQDISNSSSPQTFLLVSHAACIRLFLEHFVDANLFIVEGILPALFKITRNTGCTKLIIQVPDETEGSKICHVVFEKIHDYGHIPQEQLEKDSLRRLVNTPEGQALSGCFQV